jgi:IclR family acetate operon transcriptional repressor
MGWLWERSKSLEFMVRDVLEDASSTTGFGTLLALPDHMHMRCVLSVDGRLGQIRNYPLVGELFPAHAGATSKAYYAFVPHDQRHRQFAGRPMARFTERTVVDQQELEQDLAAIREKGYASTIGEYDIGVAALAVPLFLRGEAYGSLSFCWPAKLLKAEVSNQLGVLREAAERVERRLSCPPPGRSAAGPRPDVMPDSSQTLLSR